MSVRVHLTVDDVLRIRFVPQSQPMDDTIAIVRSALSGRGPLHPGLDPARVSLLTDLVDRCWPGFASSSATSLDAGLETLLSAPARQLARDLDDVVAMGEPVPGWAPQLLESRSGRRADVVAAYRHVYRVMIEPYAATLNDHNVRVHHEQMRALAGSGLETVLNSLHPAIRWESPVLKVDIPGFDFDIRLSGRGLVLRPSGHVADPAITHDEFGSIDTTVMYPVGGPNQSIQDLPASAPGTLTAVLGQTRANALVFLAHHAGATTTDLATGLDVSTASASEQLTLLRGAGLTRRVRKGPAVSHSLTPLGWSLVAACRSNPATAAPAIRR